MLLRPVARFSHQMGRYVMFNSTRNGSTGGVPGENLPFNIHNRKRLTLIVFIYGFTGVGAPFFILDWQLRKKGTTTE